LPVVVVGTPSDEFALRVRHRRFPTKRNRPEGRSRRLWSQFSS
jgi:hypothetical protein